MRAQRGGPTSEREAATLSASSLTLTTAAARILDQLDGVKGAGMNRWVARCPSHPDREPSLSIADAGGRTLIYCHAGCQTVDVLGALGLSLVDLYDKRTTRYPYRDAAGRLVREVIREAPKGFRQRVIDASTLPMYRLDKVTTALAAGNDVYVTEGEADAEAVTKLCGVTATTSAQGANNWARTDWTPLTGVQSRVAVVADADVPGRRRAHELAAYLRHELHVAHVEAVEPPEGFKDASDMLAAGLGLADLVPLTEPEDGADSPAEPGDHRKLVDGADWLFDDDVDDTPIWGPSGAAAWTRGESLLICAPIGLGKTTLANLLVMARMGLAHEVLGMRVAADDRPVLYLAMDRPRQIRRAMLRQLHRVARERIAGRLIIHPGPLLSDLMQHPEMIAELAAEAGAGTVVVDSVKDAALRLSSDETGAIYNRARQLVLAAGIEYVELHHVKKPQNGSEPKTIADIYGSTWIAAGAGSIILLWGETGDRVIELRHLRSPGEEVGPMKVQVDAEAGTMTVVDAVDPLVLLRSAPQLLARDLAAEMFDQSPDPKQVEAARRALERLVRQGLAERFEVRTPGRGGKAASAYRAIRNESRANHGGLF
jgi:replicative DNA helicase